MWPKEQLWQWRAKTLPVDEPSLDEPSFISSEWRGLDGALATSVNTLNREFGIPDHLSIKKGGPSRNERGRISRI